jgi:hypothetical protein
MRFDFAALLVAGAAVAAAFLITDREGAHAQPRQFTFSWQFEPGDRLAPRGGTTRGAALTLAAGPSAAWRALQEPGLDKLERDRRAILAMAGGYRTSFDFIETVGFTPGFEPARPYQSWGTEYVYVVADTGRAISLQHIMVMFVADAEGTVHGPIVQKHWRQDWRYEDRDLHVYDGHGSWQRRVLAPEDAAGRWTQAVFQVDDSPRYEAIGEWRHAGSYSAWTSETTWRPLPRRESSVRSDYHVLEGTNRHTITPTGWVQEEENLKLVLDERGGPDADEGPYLARELGVNRYEHVVDFDFSAGDRYWQRTDEFWRAVRERWARVYAERDEFAIVPEVGGREMFEPFFDYAAGLEAGERYDAAAAARLIEQTFDEFLR